MLEIWSLALFAFPKSSLIIWKFTVHIMLKPDLENFEHYFASMWNECNCPVVWTFFGIVFLWDWSEKWPWSVLQSLLCFANLLVRMFGKRSLVFPILLFSYISLHWSLRKAFLCLLAILWNSALKWVYLSFSLLLPFFSHLYIRPPQTAILLFCISFSWGWFWFLSPVPCHVPPSIVHQALYQI